MPFPPFDLKRFLQTVFQPKKGEKLCVLIDLKNPLDLIDFVFIAAPCYASQTLALEVFYFPLQQGVMQELGLSSCDLFSYEMTGGSNLDLPHEATNRQGVTIDLADAVYSKYDIILCISTYSATAPLTAAAKRFKFRGATLHGLNRCIVDSGLSVDYLRVSQQTERLRQGMTGAERIDIDFEVGECTFSLCLELAGQEAQKSHGICPFPPDIVNLPAGEVYFVPIDAYGSFPLQFEEGTIGQVEVVSGVAQRISLIRGNPEVVAAYQTRLAKDPATGILGEIGFGTQCLPFSGADIQDEKVFGTFHLATGRNDHLDGDVTCEKFKNPKNATHEDILFSAEKTPDIRVKQVRMTRKGQVEVLIEDGKPSSYLCALADANVFIGA